MLRKRLYTTEEFAPDHELIGIEHLEHCYDAPRQSLMCMVDITPLPWQWIEKEQQSKEVARVAHTCHDFDANHLDNPSPVYSSQFDYASYGRTLPDKTATNYMSKLLEFVQD
ncbi:hypothetical protein MAC_02170 [Metarhizium acridum CQMa 102]|uniref:Uncharacterized protein n=1 Tax=Metarhizium acridum (strain CQMa 102) TaxID=655827 RepID=E9DX22_METAQ|nr:uncharacterized protein MAC_02170 [Metarhizium acridum CQMa 102]EFY91885.1 hypothetical protein MAC_02170 [Metarhizium acridum CQMa 102]